MLGDTLLPGGLGCGGDDNVPVSCTHVDATLLALFLLVLTCLVIRFCLGGWGVGGMITFLFLAHMVDATLLALFLLVLTCLVIRFCLGG